MQLLPDAVIINLSPSQRRIFRDTKYATVFQGIFLAEHGSNRPRIPIGEARGFVGRLHDLRAAIASDPDYEDRNPERVIDQIVLKVEDAIAAHGRTYGTNTGNPN